MTDKKHLNKEELEKVSGGDYGRQWKISGFRQDYSKNNKASNDSAVPNDTQFKPEDVGAGSDFMNSNK